MGKANVNELLGMLVRHDELQRERATIRAGLADLQRTEAKLASAWASASTRTGEVGSRIGALRALGDLEGAADLAAGEGHEASKVAEAADAALTKHRGATRATHEKMAALQADAEALWSTVNAELARMSEREVLGAIAPRLERISRAMRDALDGEWEGIESDFRTLRPLIGSAWERTHGGGVNGWAVAIASGRSAVARRCLDEGIGLPVAEVFGPRPRKSA